MEWNKDNARFLCEGIRTAVGDGSKTLFWDHKWATPSPLIDQITQPVPHDLMEASVGDMWEDGVGWKWEVFSPYLEPNTLKSIQAHELKINDEVGDLIYWQNGPKGKFTIKSALQIIRRESNEFEDAIWKLVWRAPTQQRTRAFLWLATHDRLLGNANRSSSYG